MCICRIGERELKIWRRCYHNMHTLLKSCRPCGVSSPNSTNLQAAQVARYVVAATRASPGAAPVGWPSACGCASCSSPTTPTVLKNLRTNSWITLPWLRWAKATLPPAKLNLLRLARLHTRSVRWHSVQQLRANRTLQFVQCAFLNVHVVQQLRALSYVAFWSQVVVC